MNENTPSANTDEYIAELDQINDEALEDYKLKSDEMASNFIY